MSRIRALLGPWGMRRSKRLLTIISASALLLAACGRPTNEEYDDVAVSVGALVSDSSGGEAEAARDAVAVATGDMPAGLTASGAGTITGQRGSLDYSFEVTCRDGAGQTMTECTDLADEAHLILHWEGEVDTARWNATLVRDGDWTLTDIQSGTAIFDGTGRFDVDSEFMALYRPVSKAFQLDYDASYDGVQIRTSDRVIVGGKARYEIHAQRMESRRGRTRDRAFDVVADVTFEGENQATVVLDDLRTYRVDLTTGSVDLVE